MIRYGNDAVHHSPAVLIPVAVVGSRSISALSVQFPIPGEVPVSYLSLKGEACESKPG